VNRFLGSIGIWIQAIVATRAAHDPDAFTTVPQAIASPVWSVTLSI